MDLDEGMSAAGAPRPAGDGGGPAVGGGSVVVGPWGAGAGALAAVRRADAAGWELVGRIVDSGVLLDRAALSALAAWIADEGLAAAAAYERLAAAGGVAWDG